MPRYVALLRAINVGGAHAVKMEALRRAFEPLGFSSVGTYIASGNVIFETPIRSAARLEHLIEQRLLAALGYDVAAFVRSHTQLEKIAAYRAFPAAKMKGGELYIVFTSAAQGARSKQLLKRLQTPTDEFRVHGREIYWLRRRRPGAVPYATLPLEKTLDRPFTIRSFKTVAKLAAMR